MYKIVTLLFSLNLFALSLNAEKHVDMSAIAFKIGEQNLLAVSLVHDKDWHTYWKNPGDAGLTTKFNFSTNEGDLKLEAYPWPAPKKFMEAGEILAFGYGYTQHFFFKLNQSVKNKVLKIKGQWLVCKDICIPGEDEASIKLFDNLLGKTTNHEFEIGEIVSAYKALPSKVGKPKDLEVFLSKGKEENTLVLQYSFSNIKIENFDTKSNLLTPYLVNLFDYKHEKLFYDEINKTLYGRIYVDWNGVYEDPEIPLPKTGRFTKPLNIKFLLQYNKNKKASIIDVPLYEFSPTGDMAFNNILKKLTPIKEINMNSMDTDTSLLTFILFAFLGGLILNLMPCVLPVISLKLFGLISHSEESKSKILKHNLAYTAGVISTFMIFGAVIIFLKSTGEKVGWGFQLQSPGFVFSMMIILLVLAMNMLGLFEFRTPGGKKLGNTQLKEGMTGDFFNGVLATILSTPCSAPFLGTALTFAFTTGSSGIFLIFFFVGLGLSFPFILTGIFPALISFLPKPGAWMDKLKNILGFTLLLTFVWLYDVFMNLVDFSFFGIYYNTIFISLFMAFFFRKKISKAFIWNLILFLIPIGLTISTISSNGLEMSDTDMEVNSRTDVTWNKWSEQAMSDFSKESKWVFIDFTAKWCLTCKVNKKLVLNTDAFTDIVEENDMQLLIGDWTKRDDYITEFLNKYSIVGVPAYFMQSPSGKVIHLGETVSISKIRDTMKANQ
jgi:thiol:disulfide interchange protein DsbD